jgi:competence protein ComFC
MLTITRTCGLPPAPRLWKRRLVASAFPGRCLVTGNWIQPDSLFQNLGPQAAQQIFHITGPCCSTCGYPFYGLVEGERQCPHCCHLQPVFRRGKSAVLLRDSARVLLHALKYQGQTSVLPDLMQIARDTPDYLDFLDGAILVPVPLHWKKEWKRGFNQASLLARHLLSASQASQVWSGLARLPSPTSQTRLSREARVANVAKVFYLRHPLPYPRARYVLVDDVFTTGATLNACAQVLREAGADWIDVCSFAHG